MRHKEDASALVMQSLMLPKRLGGITPVCKNIPCELVVASLFPSWRSLLFPGVNNTDLKAPREQTEIRKLDGQWLLNVGPVYLGLLKTGRVVEARAWLRLRSQHYLSSPSLCTSGVPGLNQFYDPHDD